MPERQARGDSKDKKTKNSELLLTSLETLTDQTESCRKIQEKELLLNRAGNFVFTYTHEVIAHKYKQTITSIINVRLLQVAQYLWRSNCVLSYRRNNCFHFFRKEPAQTVQQTAHKS